MKQDIPIIVGVGQSAEPVPDNLERAASAQELAARAARAALVDALSVEGLAAQIDVIACTRTFPDSSPMWPNPFGRSNNFPRSVAKRLGCDPDRAVYVSVGGNSPQALVNEFAEELADGRASVVLLAGAEVIASTKAAAKSEVGPDWHEEIEGQLEDRGIGMKGLISRVEMDHKLMSAPAAYALLETARRASRSQSIEDYARSMSELFAPFTTVAAENPMSMSAEVFSAEQIASSGEGNPCISFPYTKRMVANDRVNQAAAVLMTTTGKARELGIPEDKWVYLHGYADIAERSLLERQNLGESPALKLAYEEALRNAGITIDDVEFLDIYSCFPIAVFAACDALGIAPDDRRGLTLTGGLPYFGGPGNNYSMHAIAELTTRLRVDPEKIGLVGANGGMLSKQAVGVYSGKPRSGGWLSCSSAKIGSDIDNLPMPDLDYNPEGPAQIETYTVVFKRGKPAYAVVIGRLDRTDARFIANNFGDDSGILERMATDDMVGAPIHVVSLGRGNRFVLEKGDLSLFLPSPPTAFRDTYEYCLVEKRAHILEITINRPEVRNCLTPDANAELEEIFDLYLADNDLWVAIITGAGDKAFCAGNDLKYTASGKPMWVPKSGFGGLTARRNRNKPVIAAVNGFAMGGGMEIALACDLIVASSNAQFGQPEVKVGLLAGAGGIQRLARQIPLKQAMKIILSGEPVGAEQALEMGLVTKVVPEGDAMKGARELAEIIAANSPMSVRCSMDLLNESAKLASIDDATNAQYRAIDELLTSEDFVEGVQAFAEKRKPNWKGK